MQNSLKKIKILNVVTGVYDGGLEMLIYRIYKGLDKSRYELNLCVLVMAEESFLMSNFRGICDNIYNLNFKNKNVKITGHIKNSVEMLKLVFLMNRNNFDIIHCHEYFPATITRIALIVLRIFTYKKPKKVYTTNHSILYFLKPIHHKINKVLSRITDRIICVSKTVAEFIIETEHIDENKLLVIHNGLNPDDFFFDDEIRKSEREKYGFKEQDIVLGNVGVLSVTKGQIYILEAINKLKKTYPDLKLLIVGTSRNHEYHIGQELRKYIRDNNLSEIVKIINTTNDINRIYNIFDIFIMSSIAEGFGLTAFEAILAGNIGVFSDIDTFKELSLNGKYGLLFENKNSESLSNVLEDIIKNKKKYESLKKDAREYVVNNFSLDLMVSEYENLYNINSK